MRIAHINAFTVGSTGRIMLQIAECARAQGHDVYTYSPYPYSKRYQRLPEAPLGHAYFGTWSERWLHNLIGRIFGLDGCSMKRGTKKLIRCLRKQRIELLHLHNLHGYCIHLPTLFDYIKKDGIKVVWTLHDCWTFTGHCPHFDMIGCDKWKTGCHACPQIHEYPQCKLDLSKRQYRQKIGWFTGVQDMTLVSPSQWLADLTRASFLRDYPVKVIHNGIDLSVFRPTESDFRQKYHCENKKILLGVAFAWGKRKGLDVFVDLAHRLDDSYQIVLVGTNDAMDAQLPSNVISIHRTKNQRELAMLYTVADLFVNPTREENYPTVQMEALACGTPIVAFRTGGCPEIIDEACGVVVEKDDINGMISEIIRICEDHPYVAEHCTKRANRFNKSQNINEYIKLYHSMTTDGERA